MRGERRGKLRPSQYHDSDQRASRRRQKARVSRVLFLFFPLPLFSPHHLSFSLSIARRDGRRQRSLPTKRVIADQRQGKQTSVDAPVDFRRPRVPRRLQEATGAVRESLILFSLTRHHQQTVDFCMLLLDAPVLLRRCLRNA